MSKMVTTTPPTDRKLTRSTTDRILAGVCGGIGRYFEIDPVVIRMVFVLSALFGGIGIFIYIVLALIIPSDTEVSDRNVVNEVKKNAEEFGQSIKSSANRFREEVKSTDTYHRRNWFGVALVILGILLILSNFGLFQIFNFGRLWPLILVILGFLILFREKKL